MHKKYLEFLTNLFNSETPPSQGKLLEMMDETMSFFRKIKEKMNSEDAEKRKEALDALAEVKSTLEGKLKDLSEKTGLSSEQLAAFGQSFFASQQNGIQGISEKIQGMNSFVNK